MRSIVLLTTGFWLLGATIGSASGDKPNLSGNWKLDQTRSQSDQSNPNLKLVIEQNEQSIHIRETRGPNAKEDVSDLTCGWMGKECEMQDGSEKASVSVCYNGPLLVVVKTNGRKSDAISKSQFSLSSGGDSLMVEVTHIDPQAKSEKLIFSKTQ